MIAMIGSLFLPFLFGMFVGAMGVILFMLEYEIISGWSVKRGLERYNRVKEDE